MWKKYSFLSFTFFFYVKFTKINLITLLRSTPVFKNILNIVFFQTKQFLKQNKKCPKVASMAHAQIRVNVWRVSYVHQTTYACVPHITTTILRREFVVNKKGFYFSPLSLSLSLYTCIYLLKKVTQKSYLESCSNSYECLSNYCFNGKCFCTATTAWSYTSNGCGKLSLQICCFFSSYVWFKKI